MGDVITLKKEPLRCPGVCRVEDNDQALMFFFSRPVSDDELRYLHEVMQRATMCNPLD